MERFPQDAGPDAKGRSRWPQRAPFFSQRGGHRIFAAVYDPVTAPLERAVLGAHRSALLAGIGGLVLDVGAGTGANLAHFRSAGKVVAAEPDPWMRGRLATKAAGAPVPVEVRGDAAEALGFEDATFDAVVCTCVLCSVRDLPAALSEVRRVLRPGGRLAVLEHVRAADGFAKWQRTLQPIWSCFNAGCHPDRDIAGAITQAGFVFQSTETFDPMPSWVLARPWLKAVAVPAAKASA
ncbi:MAG: class I SAM-dependent methyltransferase [Actinomycetota bacterium]|nr:class I SAM-dependent methyltransferase [Actinomycetota bacterium]